MSDATRIRPVPTRETYIAAIDAADALVNAAALTEDTLLLAAAHQARWQAWTALGAHDALVSATDE